MDELWRGLGPSVNIKDSFLSEQKYNSLVTGDYKLNKTLLWIFYSISVNIIFHFSPYIPCGSRKQLQQWTIKIWCLSLWRSGYPVQIIQSKMCQHRLIYNVPTLCPCQPLFQLSCVWVSVSTQIVEQQSDILETNEKTLRSTYVLCNITLLMLNISKMWDLFCLPRS